MNPQNNPEIRIQRPHRILPALTLAGVLVAGCNSTSGDTAEMIPHNTTSTTELLVPPTTEFVIETTTTLPEIVPTTENPKDQPNPLYVPNSCVDDNPKFSPYTETNPVVEMTRSTLLEMSYSEPEETREELLQAVEALQQEYGIQLKIQQDVEVTPEYTYLPVPADFPSHTLNQRLDQLASALSVYSPEIIAALSLKNIVLTGGIVRTEGFDDGGNVVDNPAGIYNLMDAIIADVNTPLELTMVHEFIHAIDHKLLCGPEDLYFDEAFTSHNSIEYAGYTDDVYQQDLKYTSVGPEREFASPYGMSTILEDRATILEWTILNRGLIKENDPDWDSPLRYKQQELVRRIDSMAPGFRDIIERRTFNLRQNPYSELAAHIPFPGQEEYYTTMSDIIYRSASENLPLTQLRGAVIAVRTNADESVPSWRVIENPVIVDDEEGRIIGYGSIDETGSTLLSGFYDVHSMLLLTDNPEAVEAHSGRVLFIASEMGDPEQFVAQGLTVDDVDVTVIPLGKTGFGFTREEVLARWPMQLKP